MSCAEIVPFQLLLIVWFCCMFVWVGSHVMRPGCHADFIQLLVRYSARFPNLCILFLLVFCIDLPFASGFMKLCLLSHRLFLHFCLYDIRLVSAVADQLST